VYKPALTGNEQPDYSPVFFGILSGKRLRTKPLQRFGFTARDGSTHSRARRTCAGHRVTGSHGDGLNAPAQYQPVCMFITGGPGTKLWAGERGEVRDMC